MSAPSPPPSAARPEPSAKVSENSRRVSMPTDFAMRRLSTAARSRAPKLVRSTPSHNRAISTKPTAIRNERYIGKLRKPRSSWPLSAAGRLHRLRRRAPEVADDCTRHEDQADGEQHLLEFAGAIEAGIEGPLEHDADQRHRDERRQQCQAEGHRIAVHQRHGDVAAGHGEHAVREVDEAHQAHRHRQADRDDVEDHRVGEAVEQDGEQRVHRSACHAVPWLGSEPRLTP